MRIVLEDVDPGEITERLPEIVAQLLKADGHSPRVSETLQKAEPTPQRRHQFAYRYHMDIHERVRRLNVEAMAGVRQRLAAYLTG